MPAKHFSRNEPGMQLEKSGSLALASLLLVASACTVTANNTEPDNLQRDDDRPTRTATPPTTSTPTTSSSADTSTTSRPLDAPKACTKMGCRSSLEIEVTGTKPGKGKYAFEIEADGKKAQCELSLPLKACDKGLSTKCTGDVKVEIGESGCALPPAEHGFGPISLPDSPAAARVVIKKDGKPLSDKRFTPAYKTSQPNGPGCEPTCKQAREEICGAGCVNTK